MPYSLIADLIVVAHFLVVVYAVAGELAIIAGRMLKWGFVRNPFFRISHLVLVAFVALQAVFGMVCPLTEWEYRLRKLASQEVEEQISFVARVVRAAIFYDLPAWAFTVAYIMFGILVVITLVLIPPGSGKKVEDR